MESVRNFVDTHGASVDCTYSFQLQAVSESKRKSYRIDFNDNPPYPCSLAELMAAIPGAEYRGEGIVPTRLTPGGTFNSYSSQEGVIHYGDNIECTLSGNGHLLVTVTNARGPEGYIGVDPYTGAFGQIADDFLQSRDVCACLGNILTHLRTLYTFDQTLRFAMGYMNQPSLQEFSQIIIDNGAPKPIVPVVVHVQNLMLLKDKDGIPTDKPAETMWKILKESKRNDEGDRAFGYLRESADARRRHTIKYKPTRKPTNRRPPSERALFHTYWARIQQHESTKEENCQLAKVDIRLKFGNRPSTEKTERPTIELFMAYSHNSKFQGLRGEENELVGTGEAVYLLQHGSDPFIVNLFRTLEAQVKQLPSKDKKEEADKAVARAKAQAAAAWAAARAAAAPNEAAVKAAMAADKAVEKAEATKAAVAAEGARIRETIRGYLQALHDQKSKSRFDDAFMFIKAVISLAKRPSAKTLFGTVEWDENATQIYEIIEEELDAIVKESGRRPPIKWPDAKPVNIQRVENPPNSKTQVFLDIKVEATHIVRGSSLSQKRVQADLGRITTSRVGVFAKLLQNAKRRLNREMWEWEAKKRGNTLPPDEYRAAWADPDPPVRAYQA